MRYVVPARALVFLLGACSKPVYTEQPSSPASEREQPAEVPDEGGALDSSAALRQPHTLERKAGTYDPLHDRAPHTGPGAPHVGDTPGTGLQAIDHPLPAPPPPTPSSPVPLPPSTPAQPSK